MENQNDSDLETIKTTIETLRTRIVTQRDMMRWDWNDTHKCARDNRALKRLDNIQYNTSSETKNKKRTRMVDQASNNQRPDGNQAKRSMTPKELNNKIMKQQPTNFIDERQKLREIRREKEVADRLERARKRENEYRARHPQPSFTNTSSTAVIV